MPVFLVQVFLGGLPFKYFPGLVLLNFWDLRRSELPGLNRSGQKSIIEEEMLLLDRGVWEAVLDQMKDLGFNNLGESYLVGHCSCS